MPKRGKYQSADLTGVAPEEGGRDHSSGDCWRPPAKLAAIAGGIAVGTHTGAAAPKMPDINATVAGNAAKKVGDEAKVQPSALGGTSRPQRDAPLSTLLLRLESVERVPQAQPDATEATVEAVGTAVRQAGQGATQRERRSARSGAPSMVRRNEHKEQGSNE